MSELLQANEALAFSGQMLVGKDHCAGKTGLPIVGFADPIYELVEYFTGSRDKSVPGVRRMMQLIGQWGWGSCDEEYAWDPARCSLVHLIRCDGYAMTKNYGWVDWREFGKRQDFWVNILLCKIGYKARIDGFPNFTDIDVKGPSFIEPTKRKKYAVVNARFIHEMDPMRQNGFKHFHVMCSEETRRERMKEKGIKFDLNADQDKSERMAHEFNELAIAGKLSGQRVIWNDHRPSPNLEFLSLDGFLTIVGCTGAKPLVAGPEPADMTMAAATM